MKTMILRTLSLVLGLAATASLATAQITTTIIDTDFSAAEGYVDGELRTFGTVNPNGGDPGVWLGQTGPMVDTSGTGTVSISGAFRRNIWNMGALGGQAGGTGDTEGGGASHPTPAGFGIGDTLRLEQTYSFELLSGAANVGLLDTGVRSNFVLGSFEAAPSLGIKLSYSEFEDGALKIFTDLTRNENSGADNPFALFIEPVDIGVDNGWNPATMMKDLPTDLVSDTIKVTWEAVYDGADTWTSTELIVENVDTATVLATASVDDPDALETVTVAGSGSEAFPSFRLMRNGGLDAGPIGTSDSFSVAFTDADASSPDGDFDGDLDVDGADFLEYQRDTNLTIADLADWNANYGGGAPAVGAVPEPSALCLLGLAAMGLTGMRKRS
ncbi:MAG: PEP-CTERM sorting domain-containing protein [Lacipirellulaceae bacterium]